MIEELGSAPLTPGPISGVRVTSATPVDVRRSDESWGVGMRNTDSWVTGRRALVTGAARGLGTAFADALGAAGAALALCDIRAEVHDVAAELADRHGVATHAWVADVAVSADVWRVVDEADAALGGIDVLVNNAGVWAASTARDELEASAATFDHVFAVNTRAPFLFGRAVMPLMRARGDGHIVNIVTDHVYTEPRRPTGGGPGMDLYDASKWALNGFTLAWAQALAGTVRVNGLCMGATDSWMLRNFHGGDPPQEVIDGWKRPADVAALMIELLEEGPGGRTGWNLPVWVNDPIVMPPVTDDWRARVGVMTAVGGRS